MKNTDIKLLTPDSLIEDAIKKLNQLKEAKKMLLSKNKIIHTEILHVRKVKNSFQYYYSIKNNKKRIYIKKGDIKKIQLLSQNRYNKKLLCNLNKNIHALEAFVKKYDSSSLTKTYTKLHEGIKINVEPQFLTEEDFCEQWNLNRNDYKKLTFDETLPCLISQNGTRVRSKSEMMIADALFNNGIPFKYEFPFSAKGFLTHPDFLCLNKRLHKEIYWEHFGLMEDENYRDTMLKKINFYQKNALKPGENFIFTMETKNQPLTSEIINTQIKMFLS